ncbi:MAG: hypothetical protein A2010_04690 [Nitrospirae bacterium GWD2_57_9]|nr:MAG: hypothetical protein A2010_04690 [Nitrospirae bacterium GWD2_57_9]OGW47700.1 MAG: hypothetical protein A2078_05820 [Nitrospirae bacterium GWC2_57_9]
MTNPWTRLQIFFQKDLWAVDRSSLNRVERFFLDAARFVVVIARDVLYGQVTLWAMGLVYTTLMSLVPLLAVSFSVLKAFGVQNALLPFLLDMVAPLGPNGEVIAHRIVEFVNNMKVGVLGTVGLALLLYTVISLIQKIEQAFNTIWRVRGQRTMLHQFSQYLSVVLVGPVLVVSALALTASLMSTALIQWLVGIEPFGTLVSEAGKLIPYVLVIAAFTFLYLFIPNTRVRFIPALVGGIIGGVLWQSVGWAFTAFMVASTKYAAIYSSFAILILFMTWVYLSWLILLVGAEASFYYQNPHLLSVGPQIDLPNARLIEQTAVSVMYLIADHFYHGKPPCNENCLVQRLGITSERTGDIIMALRNKGLIIETADDPPAYVPARDLDAILLQDVYDAVRWREPRDASGRTGIARIEAADGLVSEIDGAIGSALRSRSLKDLVRVAAGAGERKAAA